MSVFDKGHALLVGVGADLPNTITDAQGIANILKDPERCAYRAEQVTVLTEEHAKRNDILAALDQLATKSTQDSTVIFYFSGHGYEISTVTGKVYFLMPFGYSISALPTTAISGTELMTKLKAIPAKKMLVLLDCCHAGGMDSTKASGAQFSKSPIPPEAQELLVRGMGRVIIASSRANELSYAGNPYSHFTQALIEALAGAGASEQDGYVRTADLALYASTTVPKYTDNRQHPVLDYAQADNFVVAYYAAGETQAKGLPIAAQRKTGETESTATTFAKPPITSTIFNQSGQTVHGNQTNIAGNVNTGGGLFNSGNINTGGGDFIGRDRIVHGNESRMGASSTEITQLFAPILQSVQSAPAEDQSEAVKTAEALQQEAAKGNKADDSLLADLMEDLVKLVPGAVSAVVGAFASPILVGVAGPVTQHVLKRLGVK